MLTGPISRIYEIWRRTQVPDLHEQWDLRFTTIDYLPRDSEALGGGQQIDFIQTDAGAVVSETANELPRLSVKVADPVQSEFTV
jgi:hypothetical protein